MTLFTAPSWNADRPVWCITTTTGEKLWPYSPALLPRDKRYELQVGLKYFDTPAKKARPCKAWPRPDPERVALTLNLGSLDAAGVPTGQGLILTPWLVNLAPQRRPKSNSQLKIRFIAYQSVDTSPRQLRFRWRQRESGIMIKMFAFGELDLAIMRIHSRSDSRSS